MPYQVQKLIEGRGEPICVQPQEAISRALELMAEYDFSQLPVIDAARRPLGMIPEPDLPTTDLAPYVH